MLSVQKYAQKCTEVSVLYRSLSTVQKSQYCAEVSVLYRSLKTFFFFMRRPPPATGRIGPSSSARRILANVPVKSKLFALLRLNRETYVFYEHLCRGTQASTWVISHRRTTMCCSPHSFFVLSCCQLRLIRTPHLAPECRGT